MSYVCFVVLALWMDKERFGHRTTVTAGNRQQAHAAKTRKCRSIAVQGTQTIASIGVIVPWFPHGLCLLCRGCSPYLLSAKLPAPA